MELKKVSINEHEQIFLDGEEIKNITAYKLENSAGGIAELRVSMLVIVDQVVVKSEAAIKGRREKTKKEKAPYLTIWIVIAVLSINQFILAYQNHQGHQLLWDSVKANSRIVKDHIESTNQFLTELNRILGAANK